LLDENIHIGSFHFKTDLHGNPMFQILTIFSR